jgi:hypothetical protein
MVMLGLLAHMAAAAVRRLALLFRARVAQELSL